MQLFYSSILYNSQSSSDNTNNQSTESNSSSSTPKRGKKLPSKIERSGNNSSTGRKNNGKANAKSTSRGKSIRNKADIKLTSYQKEALIGLLLGDVFAAREKSSYNTRLVFDQSKDLHSQYIYFLYDLFKAFVGTPPKSPSRKPDRRTGKTYESLMFKTLRFPCFNEFHDLFYSEGKKTVPLNIKDLFTVVSFAYWIMDDGGRSTTGGLILHTNSYTLEEVQLLMSVLTEKFGIVSGTWVRTLGRWAIYIPKKEMDKVRELVSTFIHPSMNYKIS